jgi:hypothetical protein
MSLAAEKASAALAVQALVWVQALVPARELVPVRASVWLSDSLDSVVVSNGADCTRLDRQTLRSRGRQ